MQQTLQQFNFPTTIRFGTGAISEAARHLIAQACQTVLIVTDPTLVALPSIAELRQKLIAAGITVVLFYDIPPNPRQTDVEKGIAIYRQQHCDSIIGIGGGASMDTARAILLMVNHPGHLFDYEDGCPGCDEVMAENIPYFMAIPTTSGTGSEVSRSAIIADDITHQKKVIFAPPLLAKIILADPALTLTLPAAITAATGIDALVHNVEAYLVDSFHPMCDGIALEAIRLIEQSLAGAVNTPTIENRTDMMAASLMGAVAFQKGLGVVHSCAHALSAFNNMHHGLANALMFVACLKFNRTVCVAKYTRLETLLGVDDFVATIERLIKKIGIPNGLQAQGIAPQDIDTIAELALQDSCHLSNPRKVSKQNFIDLLTASL